jgi:hypothetical protein
MPRARASARAAGREVASKGNKAHGRNGTPEPRTRGEGEPDSSMDEGLEVDLHGARCRSLPNAHRATNRRRRAARSSDRTDDDLRTDDGGHRSDPMTPAHGCPMQDLPGNERKLEPETEDCSFEGVPSGTPAAGARGRGLILGTDRYRRSRQWSGAHRSKGASPKDEAPGQSGRSAARELGASQALSPERVHRASGVARP